MHRDQASAGGAAASAASAGGLSNGIPTVLHIEPFVRASTAEGTASRPDAREPTPRSAPVCAGLSM
jgi:hypothetical protein